jgi:hypothetical protein
VIYRDPVERRSKDMRRLILVPACAGIAVFMACLVVILAALASAPAASAASREHGASFAVRCDFSHRAPVDPIVYPYPPGNPPDNQNDAHSHDFLGNKSTQYNSTYDGSEEGSVSMINQPTTCTRPKDTAGYWIPTVKWNGTNVPITRAVFYYRAGGKDHTKIKSFAPDLKIINGSRITWYCGSDDEKAGSADPPTRCRSGVLGVRIIFPDCVAKDSSGGQQLDSENHRSHMVRSVTQGDGSKRCPSTHPIPVPALTINANFKIPTTLGKVKLSSGAASTMHADFWNTWDQAELERLVVNCINKVPPSDPRPEECRAPTATA